MVNSKELISKYNRTYLIAVVATCNICVFATGAFAVWTSPVLHRLDSINPDNPTGRVVTLEEQSLIVSLLSLGGCFGPLNAGLLADRIGRKNTLIYCTGILFILSVILLIFSNSVYLYYLSRFIGGVASGTSFVIVPMYFAELSEVSIRGTVSSSMNVFVVLGQLFTYAIGPFVSTMVLNISIAIIPVIFLGTFIFCPESPYYLMAKNDQKSAQKVLSKLRGTSEDSVSTELALIRDTVENDMKNRGSFKTILTNKGCRRAFLMCLGLFTFQQLTGVSAVLLYSGNIFRAAGSTLDPDISAIIVATVQVISSLMTPLFVDRFGKKALLFVSSFGTAISEIPLGLYFYLKENNYNVDYINWIPITSLVIFIFTYCSGYGAVGWIVVGEVFPADVKAKASTILTSYTFLLFFATSKLFVNFSNWFGIGGTFWIFSGFCILSFIFAKFGVMETKGKTFKEIQTKLNK